MILRRELPETYKAWNKAWNAPAGDRRRRSRLLVRALDRLGLGRTDLAIRSRGAFSIQGNNDTRVVEYPWAFESARLAAGLDVVELGGALSGFQFTLAKEGCRVVNVDPGEDDQEYWELALRLNDKTMARLNKCFGTKVTLIGSTLEEAALPAESVDRVISISTIEHIAPESLGSLGAEIARVLRPGGLCVLTIDLFLDLWPFTDKVENAYGRNINVHSLIASTGLDLVAGTPEELVGFPEWDTNQVLRSLGTYFIGTGYPVCAQAVVLGKPVEL